jgi:acyl carrier protein
MLRLREATLDWAMAHVENFGDTDIFPIPFEYEAIRWDWEAEIKPWLKNTDMFQWQVRPYRRCLTPKHRFGFRMSTQPDPIDTLIYTAIVAEIGNDIEAARLPKTDNIAFSFRFQSTPEGRMYDQNYNWDAFQEHSRTLVDSGEYRYVVTADIADFYPRIYFHPLENALSNCTDQNRHVSVLKKIIKNWNFSVSYGIPVGSAASRLLAELVIDDVDRGLISEGVVHCRYVDDFRFFCTSEKQAHEQLALLANMLFENHGLTLQQHKTRVLPIETFNEIYLQAEEEHEINSLSQRFRTILAEIGILDPYEELDYDELDPDDREAMDSLNLVEVLLEQLEESDIDLPLVKFIIRRLGQMDNIDAVDVVIDNIDALYPLFKEVIVYIHSLRSLDISTKQDIGRRLVDLLDTSLVGHLEYHKLWVLNTFTRNCDWDNESRFVTLINTYHDEFSQRELILAMGRAHHQHWFKLRKRTFGQFSPWSRRAFLAAASCLPGDEAEHWYRSIDGSLDKLEKTITRWAKANRF